MIRIVHINDDPNLGGITRWFRFIMEHLGPEFTQTINTIGPWQLWAPRVPADVIILHFPPSWRSLPWRVLLRLRNWHTSILMAEHSYTSGFEELYVRHKWRFRLMLRLSFSLADHAMVVSAGQGAWLRMAAGLSPSKLKVINPVTGLASLLTIPPPHRDGPLRLCAYGRFADQKGFDFLIDAMRLVPPEIAQLRLVGLGPDEAKLRAQAEGLTHVRIEGPVPGPETLLGEVDAVVVPSRFEAFGNVGTESRAAARPLILSDIDGLPTHALPGSRDLLVPPGDVAALAERIIWLAGQDITALGEAHRATVTDAEQHSLAAWQAMLTRLAQPAGRKMR